MVSLSMDLITSHFNDMFVNNKQTPIANETMKCMFSKYFKHPSRYVCETSHTHRLRCGQLSTHVLRSFLNNVRYM